MHRRALTATLALATALSGLTIAATPGTALASACSYLPLPDPTAPPAATTRT